MRASGPVASGSSLKKGLTPHSRGRVLEGGDRHLDLRDEPLLEHGDGILPDPLHLGDVDGQVLQQLLGRHSLEDASDPDLIGGRKGLRAAPSLRSSDLLAERFPRPPP